MITFGVVTIAFCLEAFLVGAQRYDSQEPVEATCVLSNENIQGIIRLSQTSPHAAVSVTGEVTGLAPGLHGFHIHQYGDLSRGCVSAGGHYNPFQMQHGAPNDANRKFTSEKMTLEEEVMRKAEELEMLEHV